MPELDPDAGRDAGWLAAAPGAGRLGAWSDAAPRAGWPGAWSDAAPRAGWLEAWPDAGRLAAPPDDTGSPAGVPAGLQHHPKKNAVAATAVNVTAVRARSFQEIMVQLL
ncbi:MAG TPA: hypothetical protein RMG48_10890 [Myxococcales bacterium LLY-WYZ-16_1]|nr:hypothetical protein [Myxococcales bacterium LLY-WYZ-16_1]